MSGAKDSPAHWRPSAWIRYASVGAFWAAIVLLTKPVMKDLAPLVRGSDYPSLMLLALAVVLLALAVVVHEAGHYLAARAQGMTVHGIHTPFASLLPQRGRWRVRPGRHFSGTMTAAVVAWPQWGKPVRRQLAWFQAGGALMNVCVAAMSAALATWLWPDAAARVLMAFCWLNLAIGLLNLLPGLAAGASDGAQLWRLAKGLDLGQPGMEAMELDMRAIAGETADRMPEALVAAVERESPLRGVWVRILAALNRGDWQAVIDQGERLDAALSMLDRNMRDALKEFELHLRVEIQFARSVLTGELPAPEVAQLEVVEWHRPGVVSRFAALRHALAGDWSARDRALAESEVLVEFRVDGASRITESKLRSAILQLN